MNSFNKLAKAIKYAVNPCPEILSLATSIVGKYSAFIFQDSDSSATNIPSIPLSYFINDWPTPEQKTRDFPWYEEPRIDGRIFLREGRRLPFSSEYPEYWMYEWKPPTPE